jgi:hypothetical protein
MKFTHPDIPGAALRTSDVEAAKRGGWVQESPLPTAEDLDRVAEEQRARTKQPQIERRGNMAKVETIKEVVEIADTYLTNVERDKARPAAGQPFECYFFCIRVQARRGKRGEYQHRRPFLMTITGKNKASATRKFLEFRKQHRTRIISDAAYQRRRFSAA